MQGIWFIVGSVIFNVCGQFLLKSGVTKAPLLKVSAAAILKTMFSPLVFAGLLAYGVSSVFWILALSKEDLGVAYPIVISLGIVVITLISWLFLKEEINSWRLLGILCISLGVYFIYRSA